MSSQELYEFVMTPLSSLQSSFSSKSIDIYEFVVQSHQGITLRPASYLMTSKSELMFLDDHKFQDSLFKSEFKPRTLQEVEQVKDLELQAVRN